ncbi:MAG: hypothetical protein II517_00720, partial [Ruminococcus sp.]|nr:hypothetical protein [Ruminococcus sp.]
VCAVRIFVRLYKLIEFHLAEISEQADGTRCKQAVRHDLCGVASCLFSKHPRHCMQHCSLLVRFFEPVKDPLRIYLPKSSFCPDRGTRKKKQKPLENIENMFYNLSIEFCAEVIE